jgi:Restriction endonuclease
MNEEIERIYNRLVADEQLKSGTKYERLAALVFQVLDRSSLVVHDVKLSGPGKEAEHQIDVNATDLAGQRRRVIVETRDRKESVGLKQVRDFFGVVHQLKPDLAWIVSVTGFTSEAEKYARDEGIGLAVLQPAGPEDDDRIKAIHFRLSTRAPGTPTITEWLAADDAERDRLHGLLRFRDGEQEHIDAGRSFFYDKDGARQGTLQELLEPIFQSLELELGTNEGKHAFGTVHYLDVLGVRAAVRGFAYRVELSEGTLEFTVGNAESVAELIFRSVEGTVEQPIDRVVYDTDLKGLALDAEGHVVARRN